MTSFASTTFAHAKYATFRPSYPVELYKTVLAYHDRYKQERDNRKVALDLGTGHGVVVRSLSPHFAHVHGIDPSPGMIVQARTISQYEGIDNVSFHESPAESLSFVQDAELDLVTSAEAAHWFDYDKLWPELARVVRPGGTLAVWCYVEHRMVAYPNASAMMRRYHEGQDERLLGPYWPQPGHRILQDLLRALVPPDQDWEDVRRLEYEPGTAGLGTGKGTRFMWAKTKLGGMADYMRTWSSFHEWQRRWPDRKTRRTNGTGEEGDVVDEMMDEILANEPALREQAERMPWQEIVVDIEWQSALILASRRLAA